MRKVILFIACSLDSYIAGEDDDISWLFTDADYGYTQFYSGIDTILTGRKTYDLAVKLGDTFRGKSVYVFSRTLETDFENIHFVNSSITDFVRTLKKKAGKDIWLLGGAEIITLLQSEDLIDEYIISIHPVVLGAGIPLFKEIDKIIPLSFKSLEQFPSGLIQLRYERKH